nr:RecX family transcriptional regulator [Kibdelosporangium persicum]
MPERSGDLTWLENWVTDQRAQAPADPGIDPWAGEEPTPPTPTHPAHRPSGPDVAPKAGRDAQSGGEKTDIAGPSAGLGDASQSADAVVADLRDQMAKSSQARPKPQAAPASRDVQPGAGMTEASQAASRDARLDQLRARLAEASAQDQLGRREPKRSARRPAADSSHDETADLRGQSTGVEDSPAAEGRGRSRRRGDQKPRRSRTTPDGEQRRQRKTAEMDRDPEAHAKDVCLTLLTARPRTRAELYKALLRKEIAPEVAERVLGRLDEVGLIDDKAFAEMWVRSRHTYQGMGRKALSVELRRRGVDNDTAAEAVAAVDEEAEEDRARQLVRKKLPSMRSADQQTKIRRLVGMLARKGYTQGLAYRVVKDELANAGDETDLLDTFE